LLAKLPEMWRPTEGTMADERAGQTWPVGLTRRGIMMAAAGWASVGLIARAHAEDDVDDVIKQVIGRSATESDRVHLSMPRTFPNGYTVPLVLQIDSAMTSSDHVKQVQVLAPRNPIVEVATFHFVPERSQPQISTRIRLAEPQFVVAVATMNDDALLMAKAWVEVATNGCI
jgi:sulfur-oxidizing protein SoxY